MEVDEGPSAVATPTSPRSEAQQYALDSDDETLRFDNDDDLYSSDLDEIDARWVRKQHLPAADCGEQLPATGGGAGGKNATGGLADDDDSDDDNDDDYYDDVEGDDDVSAAATSTATAAAGTPPAAGDNTGGAGAGEEGRENGGGGKKRRPQAKKKKGRARTMGVESDAQLSCPLCFTTVCLECQRHALYFNQFRAVTGINIVVKGNESLTMDQLSGGTRKRQSRRGKGARDNIAMRAAAAAAEEEVSLEAGGGQGRGGKGGLAEGEAGGAGGGGWGRGNEETFHPVCCGECDHRVGVVDEEEVLHFFNVIASG